jgi:hypothetical protein
MANKRVSELIEHPPEQLADDTDEIIVNTDITGEDEVTVRTTTRMRLGKLLADQGVSTGFHVVWNFEDMRLLPLAESLKIAFVLGNLAKGDGQGGIYYFDHESTEEDDGIAVGKPSETAEVDPGRWHQFL